MASIHSYGKCSVAQDNIKDRIASTSWEPSHALVHDVVDVEIFSFSSILNIVASKARGLSEHSHIVYRPWKYKLVTPPIIMCDNYTCTELSRRPGRNICFTTTPFSCPPLLLWLIKRLRWCFEKRNVTFY